MLRFPVPSSLSRQSVIFPYLVAIVTVFLAIVVRQILSPVLGDRVPYGTFFIAVMAVSWWVGLKAALLTLALGSFAAQLLFVPPYNVIGFADVSDFFGWAIFVIVGIVGAVVSELHLAARRQAETSARAARALAEQLEDEVRQRQLALETAVRKDAELKRFIENAMTPIHSIDKSGRIVEANQAELALLGYTDDEYVGHPVSEFHSDRDVFEEIMQRLGRGEAVRGQPARLYAHDGSIRHVLIYAGPFQGNGQEAYSRWFHHDVTERAAAEALQSRLSAIVESSDDAIVSKTLDSIVVSWNAAAERIFGYMPEEMIGRSIRLLFPPERLQEEDDFVQRLSRGEHIRHFETVRLRKDGRRIDISVTLSPIRDASGEVVGISKIAQDISERKREEQRSRLLLELSAALSVAVTREQIADAIVRHAATFLGAGVTVVGLLDEHGTTLELASSQGLPDRSVRQYHRTPIDFAGPLNEAVRTDQIVWIETRDTYITRYPHFKEAIQANGSQSIIGLPLKVNEKMLGGISFSFPFEKTGSVEEATFLETVGYQCAQALERARLYALVETEHQRLANILDTVPGIIWENEHRDEQERMRLAFISGYVETMLGYTVEEALAEPDFWFKIFHPKDAEKTAEAFYRVRRTLGSGVVNFRAVHKDGRVLHIQALMTTILQDGKPVGKRGVMMDVSERQRLLDAQTRHMVLLRRSNEELERFAYIAAHDLQEPLRMVVSYLQLIESRYISQLDDVAHEFFSFAVDGAKRMKDMLNALLDYARVDQDDKPFREFDVTRAVDTALIHLTMRIDESQAQITRDEMPTVWGDPVLISRVFQNLISNAIKFQKSDNIPKIHIGTSRQANGWEFCVRDNGIGIPSEEISRIFVLMQRLHPRDEYAGTGIGLAISKKIIERHNGRIWVESTPGEGTSFYFTLPFPPSETPRA
jgi:PAS domain S-box-containing protein